MSEKELYENGKCDIDIVAQLSPGRIEHKEHTEKREDDTRSPDGRCIGRSTETSKNCADIDNKQEMYVRAVETATIDIPHRRVHQD